MRQGSNNGFEHDWLPIPDTVFPTGAAGSEIPTMKVIQELVAYFERQGKLKPAQIDKLLKKGFVAAEAPPTMMGLCEPVGQTYYFRVHGEETGAVWGTDVYTGDSALAAAAQHAGAVAAGETRVVKVTVVEPLAQYAGSTRHGITSHSFGPYATAYQVEPV